MWILTTSDVDKLMAAMSDDVPKMVPSWRNLALPFPSKTSRMARNRRVLQPVSPPGDTVFVRM